MYYIIETEEQLQKFSEYDFTNCFIDVILSSDNYHPKVSDLSLIYIKPFRSRMGFIISIDHTETFKLPKDLVLDFIHGKLGNIYAIDGKRLRYFINRECDLYCVKTAKYIATGELIEESKYDTIAHRFFYQKYEFREDLNKIIPVSKHFEKYEKLVKSISFDESWFKKKYYKLYGCLAPKVFNSIEIEGIKINNDVFFSHYKPKNHLMSVKSDKIYTQYNLFTSTGRPSNAFNGINFGAMKKEDGSRSSFIPSKDVLIEFDYSSYHVRILANQIGYDFEEEDLHTHLAKFYFGTNEITQEQYAESKGMTFKLLYTDSITDEVEDIPFFSKIKKFKNYLWALYKKQGFIESFLSKMPMSNITSKTQILPYMLQSYETERNILVINDILEYLKDKKTKLILYNYDSFLFDYSKKDGKSVINDLRGILEQDGYKTSCKFGYNYQEMNSI